MQEARLSSRQQPEVTRTPSRRYQRRVVEGAVDSECLGEQCEQCVGYNDALLAVIVEGSNVLAVMILL